MSSVIAVENLSKKYIIGHQVQGRYTALRDVLTDGAKRFAHKILHPFATPEIDPTHEEFWALKDVSFNIQKGDRVGIIGRNGAGKSTLLKILSRITEPTTGKISIKGRVASLLEVGTGFHPELTGRENIFLNGAILGMSKAEIKRKFDEIIAFAGVEKFLDTPVKHYSSGMYVRLAFAVAAHLEPEILILDEVLAVGDAQFQQKCLGKMGEAAKEGRTVLFVSHNLGMLAELCNSAILLGRGAIQTTGKTADVIDSYLESSEISNLACFEAVGKENQDIVIEKIQAVDVSGIPTATFSHNVPIKIVVRCRINRWIADSVMGFYVVDQRARKVFTNKNDKWCIIDINDSSVDISVTIPMGFLVPGRYNFSFAVTLPHVRTIDMAQDAISISIIETGTVFASYDGQDYGCVFADCKWALDVVES
ncbi:MAG: ABC transporter ATP-binding protein [Nitrosomonadales bacterium]